MATAGQDHERDIGASRPVWQTALVCLVLVAATLAAYRPVLDNGFVEYDDPGFVVGIAPVEAGLTPGGVVWAFLSVERANWLPVTRLSWMLDAELFGMDPAGFHATSLALHALNAVLLLVAFARLTGAFWPSVFVAFAFALHPLHVESVAWVTTRKDVLSALFFMLALLAHERRARSPRSGPWGGITAGLLALGLMAKPMLVTLPFVLLLLDVWPLRRWQPGAPRAAAWALVREKALLFGLVAASCAITLLGQQHAMASGTAFPLPARLLNAMLALFDYITRSVWPVDLAVLYPLSRDIGTNRVVVAFFSLAIATVLIWRAFPARPWYLVGWLWFVGMLVPVIGIVQVGVQASADRYTYLPLIGLSIVAVWGARDGIDALPAAARRLARPAVAAAAALACIALAGLTHQQASVWRDGQTLFEHAIAVTEANAFAHHHLGQILQQHGDIDAALPHFEEALRLAPEEDQLRDALEQAQEKAAAR